ncbi:MAG: hypothetical protein KDK34_12425, partial [Leptospiraceae bacterium]|nr:hypothetical protein [Leptospiraceae bacterium]
MYDRIATELDDASGIDGFGSFFNQKVQEAQERAAQHKAMRGENLLDFNQQFRHNEYFREAVKMTIPGAGSPFDPMTRAMNAVTQRLPGFREIANMPGKLLKNAMGWNNLPDNWMAMNSEEINDAMDGKYTRRALRDRMEKRIKTDYETVTKLRPKDYAGYYVDTIRDSFLFNKLAEALGEEKPMTTAERTFRESTSQIWADATGISLELAESLYVDQLSLDEALENEFYRQFEEQVQLDGAGDYLRELKEKTDYRKKKHEAMSGINLLNPNSYLEYTQFGQWVSNNEYLGAAMTGGGMPLLSISNYKDMMNGELKGAALLDKLAGLERIERFSKMNLGTGFQEIIQNSGLGALMTVLSKPQDQMSAAEYKFRTSLAEYTAWAFGAPEEFMKTIMVEEGDLETAIMNQFWQNVEDQYGIDGLGDVLAEQHAEALKRKAAHKAGRVAPEDFATFGLTYTWRNAEHNKALGLALQVVETAASVILNTVGNIIPGVGTALYMGYMIAKQTYLGSLHGGTKGAAVGWASGMINAFTSQFGVGVNLNYDFENGFGGSIGYSGAMGSGGFTGGGSISFQEGQGVTGFGLNAGYNLGATSSGNVDTGFNLGANFDTTGRFQGGNVGVDFSKGAIGDGRWTTGLGMNIDADGNYSGFDINMEYAKQQYVGDNPFSHFSNKYFTSRAGGGLSFGADGSIGLNLTHGLDFKDPGQTGFSGVGVNSSGTTTWMDG